MIWLCLIALGVLALAGTTRPSTPALPLPEPALPWRGKAVEAAACEIMRAPPGGTMPSAAEIRWLVAKAAYPEESWPRQPGDDLPDGSSQAKAQLWAQLGDFAHRVRRLELACPEVR